MAATWVLILLLKYGYAGGAVAHEFNSQEACIAAAKAAMERAYGIGFVCVPK